jgi:hypothetical protein
VVYCVQLLLIVGLQLEYRGVRSFPGRPPVWAEREFTFLLWIRVIEPFGSFLGLDPFEEFGHNLPLKDMLDLIVCTRQTPGLPGSS